MNHYTSPSQNEVSVQANLQVMPQLKFPCKTSGVSRHFADRQKLAKSCAIITRIYRTSGLTNWLKQIGWRKLLKKTGPTWGKLPEEIKASIRDDASALALMLEKPNVIKRPVLEHQGKVLATGFNLTDYETLKI